MVRVRSFAVAVTALALLSASAVVAQEKTGGGTTKKPPAKSGQTMDKKSTMSGVVYVCKGCKAYYSAADAKKMGMKDPMGHKLVSMKKAPAGYKRNQAGKPMKHGTDKGSKTGDTTQDKKGM